MRLWVDLLGRGICTLVVVAIPCVCIFAALRFLAKRFTKVVCTCCEETRGDRKRGVAYILERGQRPTAWFGECDGCVACKRHQPPEPDENRYVTSEESTPYR